MSAFLVYSSTGRGRRMTCGGFLGLLDVVLSVVWEKVAGDDTLPDGPVG